MISIPSTSLTVKEQPECDLNECDEEAVNPNKNKSRKMKLIYEYDADDSDSEVSSSYSNNGDNLDRRSLRSAQSQTAEIRIVSTPANRKCDYYDEKELAVLAPPRSTYFIGPPRSATEVFDKTQEELSIIRDRIDELKIISEEKEKEFIVLSFEIAKNEEKTLKHLDMCRERVDERQSWKKKANQIKRSLELLNEDLDSMNKSLLEKDIYHCISLDLSNHELKKISELKEFVKARVVSLDETTKSLQRWTHEAEKLEKMVQDCYEIYEHSEDFSED